MKLRDAAIAALALAAVPGAAAQDYPARTVRLIAPTGPGGATDTLARMVAQKLSERWHRGVIVDNRVGATGNIGAEITARSAPDGYTLVVGGAAHAINMTLYRNVSYDLGRDLAAVARLAGYPSVIVVHPSLPVASVKGLIALARARPGQLNFGSPAPGSPNRLAMVQFMIMAGVKMTDVPYKGGSGQMVIDLVAGQVQLASMGLPPSIAYIESGRLRALAVTSLKRASLLPHLPTVSETGLPGFDVTTWFGVFAPAALPKPLVAKLNGEINALLDLPDVKERLARLGAEPMPQAPEDFARYVREEIVRWGKIVKAAGGDGGLTGGSSNLA